MKPKPFFSIVIPTLNEAEYLPLLLTDLVEQTNTDFEVIHVDGNSEDETVQKASKFKVKLDLQTIETTTRNVSYQRNIGIKNAKGTWIIFMDADNRLPRYFLDGIRYRLAIKQETDIFTTWIQVSGNNKVNEYIEKTFNFISEVSKNLKNETALGAMIGVKNVIAQKHRFNEKEKVMEDYFFIKEIVDAGHTFGVFKDPKYVYSLRRIEAKGLLSYIQINSKILFNYFVLGNSFTEKNHGYEMGGGKSHQKTDRTVFNLFLEFESHIKKQPTKKIEQTKKLFKALLKR